jgi:hypothetical protein
MKNSTTFLLAGFISVGCLFAATIAANTHCYEIAFALLGLMGLCTVVMHKTHKG